MNYANHYARLIARARGRVLSGYKEWHHIIPRCMGGNDEKTNLVALTGDEHYVAHQLLVKIHPGHAWLALAATRMSKQCTGSRAYGWLRRRSAKAMSAAKKGKKLPPCSEEAKKLLRARFLGKPLSLEHRAKISAAKAGKKRKPFTEETRSRISAARTGMKFSPSHCAAIGAARRGTRHSKETIAKVSAGLIGKPKSKEHRAKLVAAWVTRRQSQRGAQ